VAARNTAVLVVLRLVVPMLSLALVLTLSRALGAEGLGRYTLTFSFLTLFGGLAPLGLPSIITRDGARDRARLNALLRSAMTLVCTASLLLTLVMIASAFLLGYDRDTRIALLILSCAVLPYSVGMLLDGAIVAVERMQYMAAASLAEYLPKVAIAVALLLLGFGLEAVLITAVVGRLAGCLVAARLLRQAGVMVGWSRDSKTNRHLLALAPTFLLTSVFVELFWRIDILMLSTLVRAEELGYFSAAHRLFELAAVFPQSLCLSLYPQIAAAARSDPRRLPALGGSAMRYLAVFGLPAAVFVTLLSGPILRLLYGAPFGAAADTLSVLAWTIVPYSFVRYHAYVLVAANRQRVDLLLNLAMCMLNIALNLVLIPAYSYFGAACATLASISTVALLQYLYLRYWLDGHAARLRLSPVMLGATALVALAAWLTRDLNTLVPIAIAPVIYLAVLFLGGFFSSAELKVLGVHTLMGRFGMSREER
jgi:O-antigen/teichoic acid export membrane protein